MGRVEGFSRVCYDRDEEMIRKARGWQPPRPLPGESRHTTHLGWESSLPPDGTPKKVTVSLGKGGHFLFLSIWSKMNFSNVKRNVPKAINAMTNSKVLNRITSLAHRNAPWGAGFAGPGGRCVPTQGPPSFTVERRNMEGCASPLYHILLLLANVYSQKSPRNRGLKSFCWQ